MTDQQDDASRFVGLTLDEAARVASAEGLFLRVEARDAAYTLEYDARRVTVTVTAGRVQSARRG